MKIYLITLFRTLHSPKLGDKMHPKVIPLTMRKPPCLLWWEKSQLYLENRRVVVSKLLYSDLFVKRSLKNCPFQAHFLSCHFDHFFSAIQKLLKFWDILWSFSWSMLKKIVKRICFRSLITFNELVNYCFDFVNQTNKAKKIFFGFDVNSMAACKQRFSN